MTFREVLEQVRARVRESGRVTYRALKREFALADDYLEDVKAELIVAERVAQDEDGKVLVWIGEQPVISARSSVVSPQPPTPSPQFPIVCSGGPSPPYVVPAGQG